MHTKRLILLLILQNKLVNNHARSFKLCSVKKKKILLACRLCIFSAGLHSSSNSVTSGRHICSLKVHAVICTLQNINVSLSKYFKIQQRIMITERVSNLMKCANSASRLSCRSCKPLFYSSQHQRHCWPLLLCMQHAFHCKFTRSCFKLKCIL